MKSLQKSFIIITVLAFGGAIATPALALSAANYSASLSIVAQLVDIANVHADYRASIVPAVSAYLTSTSASADLVQYPIEQANIKAAASLMAMANTNPGISASVLPTVKASLTASSAAFATVAGTTAGTGGIKPMPPTSGANADIAVKYANTLSNVQQLVDLAVASPSASASIVSSLSTTLNTLAASADLVQYPKELAEIKAAAALMASIKSGQSSAEVVLPSVKATIASSQASFSATAATAGTGGIKPMPPTTTANPNAAVTYASTLATVNQLLDLAVANPNASDDIVANLSATLNTLAASADLVHYPAELAEIKAAAALMANVKSGQSDADVVLPNVKASLAASQTKFATIAATAATAGTGGIKPIPTQTGLSADQAVRAQLSADKYASSLAVIKQIIDLGEGNDLSTDSIIKSVSAALDSLVASADLAQFPAELAEIKALATLAASVKNNPAAAETVLPNIKASLTANVKNFASLSADIKATSTQSINTLSSLATLKNSGFVSLAALQNAGNVAAAVNLGSSDAAGQFITTGCFAPSFTSSEQISYDSTGSKDAMSPVLKDFLSVYCKSIL